ncbi:MAG: glycosyltransferase family 4 protein [Symploca sp. SIO3C6]|nr:glycosyltransferase family 4 protein [Symploca sp. SIO3C6]NET05006.1 glycosyltransferase family 4 protein [Symploca sp. SIO2B6]
MPKHYIVFTRKVIPQPNQSNLVWAAHTANAAANLGYSAVLTYACKDHKTLTPFDLIQPFRPKKPDQKLLSFYNLQPKLKVSSLPLSWPIDHFGGMLMCASTVVCEYYLPIHIKPLTAIVHTRDWNFAKAAVEHGVPVIYEQHYCDNTKKFEPRVVRNPLLQVVVTLSDIVRENMIQRGMPKEKIIKLHSGVNQMFLIRKPEEAEEWRQKLLVEERKHLVIYSGELCYLKGINMLIDVAKELTQIQFAIAGGTQLLVKNYQKLAQQKQVKNVTFLGYLPQNQLTSLLQAADILAHPHGSGKWKTARSTSPLKFFDYLASGNPIVATKITNLMEFKSSKAIIGWCEPDSPTQFAQCIQQVLATHPRKLEGYKDNLDLALQFSWENRIKKILSYVDNKILGVMHCTNHP